MLQEFQGNRNAEEPIFKRTENAMHLLFSRTFASLKLEVSSHDFRHSKITELINAGIPLTDVQSYVGHTRPDTTLSYVKKKQTKDILAGMVAFNL